MSTKKISELGALGAAPASDDLAVIVDVSDTTDAASGTTKKITYANLVTGYAAYSDATANFTGTLQNGGSNVVVDSDIGVTVQGYDANTANYSDATANFTGTLQNGGSNVVVDSDIGVTVQGYDANTAKYDATTANFTGTLQNGGSNVVVDSDIGSTVQAYDANLTSYVSTFTLPTSDGTAEQVIATNGSGTLSFVNAGGGGKIEATASGALANGDPVVVNSDGTVSVISTSDPSAGSNYLFESASTQYFGAVYDPINAKVVICYMDVGNSLYGTAIVGTVSDTVITFGTAVVFASVSAAYESICYDSVNEKIVIAYADNAASNAKGIVGTVSGDSISFGTATTFETGVTWYTTSTFDSNAGTAVHVYRDQTNSGYGTAVVGTVSGTSITYGTPVVFESDNTVYPNCCFDSTNNKVVAVYRDNGNSNYGTAIIGTVSGTTISFGSPVVFSSATSSYLAADFDVSAGKVLVAFQDGGNSNYGTGVVGTVSGTTISFGTEDVFESASITETACQYDASASGVGIAYNSALSAGKFVLATISGTTPSFSTPITFHGVDTDFIGLAYDSANARIVAAYENDTSSDYGWATVIESAPTNLTNGNLIGISNGAYSDTATATIQTTGGVDDAQSGLTAGLAYYVTPSGALSTSASGNQYIGIALSATEILIKG